MLDTTYFISWMWKLLDFLNSCGIKSVVIVMENNKSHNTFPEDTNKGNWNKKFIIDYFTPKGVEAESN